MTLKSSFSKLLKQQFIHRSWNLAIVLIIFFFLFPVNMILYSNTVLDPVHIQNTYGYLDGLTFAKQNIFAYFRGLAGADSDILSFIMVVLALMLANSGFSYLHDTRRTDFYHSLPLKRGTHYLVIHTASLLMLAVPYLVFSFAAAVATYAYSGFGECFLTALFGYISHLCFFALFYMTIVLAILLTGNQTTGILGSIVLLLIPTMYAGLIYGYCDLFFESFYEKPHFFERLLQCSSPFFLSLDFSEFSWKCRAAVSLLLAAVLYVICLKIYNVRRSEAAGHAMAFNKTKAPIKVLIAVPSALFAALILTDFVRSRSLGWGLFGLFCGLILSCAVIEIIYHSDFRKFHAGKKSFGIALVLALGIYSFFYFDLSGYDRFMPNMDKVASVGVHTYALEGSFDIDENAVLVGENNFKYIEFPDYVSQDVLVQKMQLTNLDSANAFAAHCVDTLSSSDTANRNILFCWHMKNGKDIYRNYYVNPDADEDWLYRLYDMPEYKQTIYPIFDKDISNVVSVAYENADGENLLLRGAADADKITALYDTYCSELMALRAETRRSEYPVVGLQFRSRQYQEALDRYESMQGRASAKDCSNYPVYPSFHKTLALLKQYGADLAGSLKAEDLQSIILADDRFNYYSVCLRDKQLDDSESLQERYDDYDAVMEPLVITDPEEMRKILSCTINRNLSVSNYLFHGTYNGLSVAAHTLPKDKKLSDVHYLYFVSDKLPASVKSQFGIDDQDLELFTE